MKTKDTKRVVVKLGSSVIFNVNQTLNKKVLMSLAQQVRNLQNNGWEIVIVCSGAVAYGQILLNGTCQSKTERQATAAVGQAHLISVLVEIFSKKEIMTGQLLLEVRDLKTSVKKKQIRKVLEKLLFSGIVPVINENDALDLNCFGGNDYLSAEILELINCKHLIVLSNVKGLIGQRGVISFVENIDDSVKKLAWSKASENGIGGMKTKLDIARKITLDAKQVTIASGFARNVLERIVLENETLGTRFLSKRW